MTDILPARGRRVLLALAALLAAGLLLSACGGDDDKSDAAGARTTATTAVADGPWTMTDDRGVKVERDAAPVRVVANEANAAALSYAGIKPVGVFVGHGSVEDSPMLEGVDLDGVEVLGENYGEINVEKLAALKPDLVVTSFNRDQLPLLFGFKNPEQQRKVERFAPIFAIEGTNVPTVVIDRHQRLAASLGADLDAPEIAQARADFEASVRALRAALAKKPNLSVTGTFAEAEQLYYAKPAEFPFLREYQDWGLRMVDPGGRDPFWNVVSWEQADRVQADLVLVDERPTSLDLRALDAKPTWRQLPAVEAGQLVPWMALDIWNYPQWRRAVDALTEGVEKARDDVVVE